MFSISQKTLCKLLFFLETKERRSYRVLSYSSGCVQGKATLMKAQAPFNLPPIATRNKRVSLEFEEIDSSRHSYSFSCAQDLSCMNNPKCVSDSE